MSLKLFQYQILTTQPRSFFDNLNNWAISEGASGMAYMTFEKKR